jgi:Tfp pilus assembly protein PilF
MKAQGRKIAMGALLLVLLGTGAYAAGRHFYAAYHLRAAEQALGHYEFEEAQEHLAACLRVRPDSAALHLEMARAARRATQYERAAEHLAKCRQLEGTTAENALEGLLLRAQRGEVTVVEGVLQEQVDAGSPDASQILEALALGYVQVYRLDAAMFCLNHLLEREPDNVQALLWRASLWQTARNEARAEADVRRAIEAQPEHGPARCRLGEILLRRQQPEEALRQFEYARQRPGGEKPDVLLGLARSHWQLGQADTARQVLDDLLAHHPDNAIALVERGRLALARESGESPAAAETWLRRAVASMPYDPHANYLLAQSLRSQGKEDEARPYEAARERIEKDFTALEAAVGRVARSPADPEPRLEAGLICLRNGREDEGERWLLSALEQAPDHAATRAALAEHYERTGQRDLAETFRRPLSPIRSAGRPRLPVSAHAIAPGGK